MGDQHQILILKTGAAGDVVRTTCILSHFQDSIITWLTDAACMPLFDTVRFKNLNVYPVNNFPPEILVTKYQLVLSLEEDEYCARIAGRLHTEKITGIYWNNGFAYTEDAAGWFNMSLVSIYGRARANELKRSNTLSYPEHLFSMLQLRFAGESYNIFQPETTKIPRLIGIEKTAGHRWPNKTWGGYDVLAGKLQEKGFQTLIFEHRANLLHYMQAINSCSLVVSGDTLAMHLAMAYKIPVVGLFNCTSPAEIYDYELLHKLVSARVYDFFYSTDYDVAAVSAISSEIVLDTIQTHWNKNYAAPNQTEVHESF